MLHCSSAFLVKMEIFHVSGFLLLDHLCTFCKLRYMAMMFMSSEERATSYNSLFTSTWITRDWILTCFFVLLSLRSVLLWWGIFNFHFVGNQRSAWNTQEQPMISLEGYFFPSIISLTRSVAATDDCRWDCLQFCLVLLMCITGRLLLRERLEVVKSNSIKGN